MESNDWSVLFDPLGVFHDRGIMGWDIFDLDTTSENIKNKAIALEAVKQKNIDTTNEKIEEDIKIVFFVMLILSIAFYSFKYYKKKHK